MTDTSTDPKSGPDTPSQAPDGAGRVRETLWTRALRARGLSLRRLASTVGVGRSTVADWLARRTVPSPEHRAKVVAAFPEILPAWADVEAPEPRTATAKRSDADSLTDRVRGWRRDRDHGLRDFVDLGALEVLSLKDSTGEAQAALTERERVLCSPAYSALREAALAALQPGPATPRKALAGAMPEPATTGTPARLATVRGKLAELLGQIDQKLASVPDGTKPRLVHALLRLQLSVRQAVRETEVPTRDLVSTPTFEGICADAAAALKPFGESRALLVAKLGTGDALSVRLAAELDRVQTLSWPSLRYEHDPVGFFHDVLGLDVWKRQIEIIEATRDRLRVVVRSGHRVGKSFALAGLALWYFCLYPDAQVIFVSATEKQIRRINLRDVHKLWHRAGRCLACVREDPDGPRPCPHSATIPAEWHKDTTRGLETGERSIIGVVARDTNAMGGYSGPHMLFIVDEANGVADEIFDAVESIAAGGAHILVSGNPVRMTGFFIDICRRKERGYHEIWIKSTESPNVVSGKLLYPGLAVREWVELQKAHDDAGEESPFFQSRVLGIPPTRSTSSVYAFEDILGAQDRSDDADRSGPELVIALDPAGPSGKGDESVFTVGRGHCVITQSVGRGWDVEEHFRILLELISTYRYEREPVVVAVDADGVGADIRRRFAAEEEATRRFHVIPIFSGQNAKQWQKYDLVRDELHASAAQWLRDGAIPRDFKLEQELEIMTWTSVRRKRNNREIEVLSATRTQDIRRELHRSPDRLMSLVYLAAVVMQRLERGSADWEESTGTAERVEDLPSPSHDPYAALGAFQAGGAMDPYRGAGM